MNQITLKDEIRAALKLLEKKIGPEACINLCSDILGYTHDHETLLDRRNRLGEESAKNAKRVI